MCRQAGGGGGNSAGGVLRSRHAGCQEGAGRLVTLGSDLEGWDSDGGVDDDNYDDNYDNGLDCDWTRLVGDEDVSDWDDCMMMVTK